MASPGEENPRKDRVNMNSNRALGFRGEEIAAEYMQSKGYAVLHRNYRTEFGEIDLILCSYEHSGEPIEKVPQIIFVEVKTRSNTRFGFPETGITEAKQEHLTASVDAFLQEHPDFSGEIRIDVISILMHRGEKEPEIVHFENAVY